ncbi:hypothetical protein MMC07_006230 [Pseudocyphellaria aurata]|nr:hypothetical protein [Pseudocyphellaria aurata]
MAISGGAEILALSDPGQFVLTYARIKDPNQLGHLKMFNVVSRKQILVVARIPVSGSAALPVPATSSALPSSSFISLSRPASSTSAFRSSPSFVQSSFATASPTSQSHLVVGLGAGLGVPLALIALAGIYYSILLKARARNPLLNIQQAADDHDIDEGNDEPKELPTNVAGYDGSYEAPTQTAGYDGAAELSEQRNLSMMDDMPTELPAIALAPLEMGTHDP